AMRPGYDTFLNVFSHIINLARYLLGASPAVTEAVVQASGAAHVALDFGGIACTLDLENGSEGVWREGLTIHFERGALTIELPPPFAAEEARIALDRGGDIIWLTGERSWAFRRQADAFISDIVERRTPLASGEDAMNDIAIAEAVWKRQISG